MKMRVSYRFPQSRCFSFSSGSVSMMKIIQGNDSVKAMSRNLCFFH